MVRGVAWCGAVWRSGAVLAQGTICASRISRPPLPSMADANEEYLEMEIEVERLRNKVEKLQDEKMACVRAVQRALQEINKLKAILAKKGKGHRGGRVKEAKEE